MPTDDQQHRAILQSIAHRVMIERGLLPDFSAEALAELHRIQAAAGAGTEPRRNGAEVRDLTSLLWASIDNDDSLDLDQLTVAEALPGDEVKILRQVGKSAAALFLEPRIGEQFDAIVTGAADKGTYARLLTMPVEGRVVQGFAGVDVGDRIRVELVAVEVERGYIDFGKVGSSRH